jgi:hypothetical protein
MRHKGLFWGLAILPVWGLAGGLLLLVSLGPFFQLKSGFKALGHHKVPALILLLLLTVPLLTSPNPVGHVIGFLSRYLLPLLLLRAFWQYLQQAGTPEVLSKAMLWGGLGLAGLGGFSLILPRPLHWQVLCLPADLATQACILDFSLLPVSQAQGFAMNPNIFGGLLVLVLPFVWLAFEPDDHAQPTCTLSVVALLILTGAILLSGSRNAVLAMTVSAGGLLPHGASFKYRWQGAFKSGGVTYWLWGLLCVVLGGLWILGGSQRYSDTGRWVIWKVGVAMLQQFPWTGVGILSVEPMYQRLHGSWPHAAHLHNGFLQIMVECGIFSAFALFSYIAYRVYNQSYPSRLAMMPLYQRLALNSVLLVMGMSVVDFILLDIRVMVYMTAIVACAFYPSKLKPALSVNEKI